MLLADIPWRPPEPPGNNSFSRFAEVPLPGGKELFFGERKDAPNNFCVLLPGKGTVDCDALELQCLLYHYLGGNDDVSA